MSKKSPPQAARRGPAAATDAADLPVVGAREPCPCGSGRRYKACHGRRTREVAAFAPRPFDGLPHEVDWVALREFVPAGSAQITLAGEYAGRTATLVTLLPMAWAGLVRADGEPLVALQVPAGSGDPSRDHAEVLEQLLAMAPGGTVEAVGAPTTERRLQDLVDPATELEVTVHDSFAYWDDGIDDPTGLVAASRERADEAATPTARLESVDGAYWCRAGDKDYLRWVRPEPEDRLVDALARLHVRGEDLLGAATRQVGAFRAHGLLVAVWDLPPESDVAALSAEAAAFDGRLAAALADDAPLTTQERSARAGLVNRQRTLR